MKILVLCAFARFDYFEKLYKITDKKTFYKNFFALIPHKTPFKSPYSEGGLSMDNLTAVKIKELRQKGCGYKKIASDLNLPQSTVKSFLKRTETQTDTGITTCLYCGKPTIQIPHKRQKKYCSDKCRLAWWKEHKSGANNKSEAECRCSYCGKPFMSYPSKKRKYCSRNCYISDLKKERG